MTEELKPCPFCGSSTYLERYQDEVENWQMLCRNCYARGPLYNSIEKSIEIISVNYQYVCKQCCGKICYLSQEFYSEEAVNMAKPPTRCVEEYFHNPPMPKWRLQQ